MEFVPIMILPRAAAHLNPALLLAADICELLGELSKEFSLVAVIKTISGSAILCPVAAANAETSFFSTKTYVLNFQGTEVTFYGRSVNL